MKFQRETDYALRCVLCLAGKSPENVCSEELVEAIAAPRAYVKKIVTKLRRAGIVETRPGPGGGIRLAKPPSAVSVYDVVCCVEGELCINGCLGPDGACSRGGIPTCGVHQYLQALQSEMIRSMKDMTFDRLLRMNGCCRQPEPRIPLRGLAAPGLRYPAPFPAAAMPLYLQALPASEKPSAEREA